MYPLGRKQKFFSRNVLLFSLKYETSTTASSYAVGLYLHDSIESGGLDFSKAAVSILRHDYFLLYDGFFYFAVVRQID